MGDNLRVGDMIKRLHRSCVSSLSLDTIINYWAHDAKVDSSLKSHRGSSTQFFLLFIGRRKDKR